MRKIHNKYLILIIVLLALHLFVMIYFLLRDKNKTLTQDTTTKKVEEVHYFEQNEPTPAQTSAPGPVVQVTTQVTTKPATVGEKSELNFTLVTKSPYARGIWKVYGKIIVPTDAQIHKSNTKVVVKKGAFELVLEGNDDMSDSVFKPYTVLPGYKKVGTIRLLTADGGGYITSDLYRIAYQTSGNIFYTNNFEENKKCEVAGYSENPPCAWPTISFSTKTFIWATLECGAEQPSQECLDWGDNIMKTLEIRH